MENSEPQELRKANPGEKHIEETERRRGRWFGVVGGREGGQPWSCVLFSGEREL